MNERFKPHTYEGEHEKGREGFSESPVQPWRPQLQAESTTPEEREIGKFREYIKYVLSTINETALEDIFKKEIGKSGGNIDEINFRPISEINITTLPGALGMYTPRTNEISLNENLRVVSKKIENLPEEKRIPVMCFVQLKLLHTTIHEETHAVGHNSSDHEVIFLFKQGSRIIHGTRIIDSLKSGFLRHEIQKENLNNHEIFNGYRAINEGVTELIAHRILQEYLRQNPPDNIPSENVTKFLELLKTNDLNAYAQNLFAIKLYIALISKATDVPTDTVENALIRAYFRGSDFISDEMVKLMDELLGEDMGASLRHSAAKNEVEFVKAIQQADVQIDPAVREKLLRELL